jgi:hypothetical protein
MERRLCARRWLAATLSCCAALVWLRRRACHTASKPRRNPESKKQLNARARALSETLTRTLREQFHREIGSGKQRLEESLAPYTRFVRIESERAAQVKKTLESLRTQTRDLRQRIDGGDSVMEVGARAEPTQPPSRSAK